MGMGVTGAESGSSGSGKNQMAFGNALLFQ